jgi:hypothetical protein
MQFQQFPPPQATAGAKTGKMGMFMTRFQLPPFKASFVL